MNLESHVAVCSRSFSRDSYLRGILSEKYRNIKFNDSGEALADRDLALFLRGHDKAIIALEKIDINLLSQLPELKVISKYGVGLDMIDFPAMVEKKISLGWFAGVNKTSVAEMVIGMVIHALRNTNDAMSLVKNGGWRQIIGRELSGATIGIVGCGHVGHELIRLLTPFKCNILIHDILDKSQMERDYGVKAVSLEELLMMSDVVSIHVPLDSSTRYMFGMNQLALMQKGAILINFARGGIVDEKALQFCLENQRIKMAIFDVFDCEPPQNNALLSLANFIATPHIGGSSINAIRNMGIAAINGLDDYYHWTSLKESFSAQFDY
ncbi:phosphoglycerate dehydrogenase [Polynucleobacter sp. Adler-ghost]|uniref:phosphoglycerate dehydrogenase n=1 Tax=Polynucleobacter sp. Adler-ghost TaxID=2770234 RepID=UPI001BFDC9BA|nr:phosphoglycerate dehydrogenase [Polynucleobacter sp. Adler-ghost]QWE31054.1 phosphoglycerate dehydrogenase [Polynucleobacter sp. Adler-ghost]